MQEQQRNYWAFLANPKFYRIERAIQELDEDVWNVPQRKVRAGDRAIIWKAKGNDQQRGIIALVDILTDPTPARDPNRDYWVNQHTADEIVDRIAIRYLVPSALPLWVGRVDLPILEDLTVKRATGGSIFHVSPNQWSTIMDIVGGWPGSPPEIASAEWAIAQYAGKRRSGQGFVADAERRGVIELYAMQKAKAFYEEKGWSVSDVSSTHPYDLLCCSATGQELHVEVKGTTSEGTQIFLTANEVKHAQAVYPHAALFILSHIDIDPTIPDLPQGGKIHCFDPWDIREGTLSPLAFAYTPE